MVVPILAPIIMPILCEKVMRFALIKLTVKAVVAELDWMIQVIKQPIRIALKVEEVHLARRFFKRVGESSCKERER